MIQKTKSTQTIFQKYFSPEELIDRYQNGKINKKEAVDVIIPVIHTNDLWRKNLFSVFREIPVQRLLIGDGGCIDDSIKIAKEFPRVTVYNHRKIKSLGFSIKKLISEVKTEWFIYLHSDVYLPVGWFDAMKTNKKKYDWFECRQQLTVMVSYPLDYSSVDRPLSGSQMGKKSAFDKVLPEISDDYLYRNEDLIFAHLIGKHGYRYGRVDDVFHFHQIMDKKSKWGRWIKNVNIEVAKNDDEKYRENIMQAQAIIKYMDPDNYQNKYGMLNWEYLLNEKDWNQKDFENWVARTNDSWLPYVKKIYFMHKIKQQVKNFLKMILHAVKK